MIKCNYSELKDPDLLVEHPRNANKHGARQIELLAKIIDHTGFRHPIVVSKLSGYICAGHGRLMAAKKLGLKEVPVEYQEFKNEAEEFQFLIADNRIAELAEHDDNLMIDGIKELGIEDFELLGLEDFEIPLEPDPAKEEIEDEVPENVETRCKPGDLWILGEHRLLCGDATNVLDVEKLMGGAKADMVFTDPPYGINLNTDYVKSDMMQGNTYKPIENDNKDFDPGILFGFFCKVKEIFVWGANNFCDKIDPKGSWIVWDKSTDKADAMISGDFELCYSKQRHKYSMARIYWKGMSSEKEQRKVHPSQKPVQLVEWFFDKWGKDKTNIADLFGGSGSTLIACEKTNRKCYMMELDPHYCSVILSRWEKYSGKEAKLHGNG